MNWDDLRIIAAVAEEGTYAGASARLRVNETTVARRLARLERDLGFRLFEAADGIRRPTQQCDLALAHVLAISRHATEINKIGGDAPGPSGRFRIASTSTIAEEILSPRAADLLLANPGLSLQFLTANENVNFSRWEADLAIRLRKPERGDFAISKLVEIRLYFIEAADAGDSAPIVCSYSPDLDLTKESQFLRERGLQQRSRCVADNLRIIRSLIETRQAIGILPDYLCGRLLSDRRLRVTPLPRRRDIWLLVQNHLKRDRAARLVIDWIRRCFREAPAL